jgi:hypothetical protein
MADPSPVAAPALLICVEGDDDAAASPVVSPILALKKYARRHRADDDAAASRDEGEPSPLPFVSNALFEERAAFNNVRVGRNPALDDSDDATSSSSDDDDDEGGGGGVGGGATRRPLGRTTMKLRSRSRAEALAEVSKAEANVRAMCIQQSAPRDEKTDGARAGKKKLGLMGRGMTKPSSK